MTSAHPAPLADASLARPGRAPVTTHGELSHIALTMFLERGFDETTVNEIAQEAGIGRRTFFRYFSSKNELPWGDFGSLLDNMRVRLSETDPAQPLADALRSAIISFNTFPEEERDTHRKRMWLLLNVPSLTAYSTLKYESWRRVIAEFIGARRGESPDSLTPQSIAWACLGLCLAAYERWLADDDSDLLLLLDSAFASAASTFSSQAS
ncbi:mycofactocin system transcriptional regulator [Leucobacter sp. USHLN153]|uniref:mycofactocin system transcriptional regulator n=1 Tax=Leucobacter sp. USHLN153 TaxID=3081268 RepID=UPI0030178365